MSPIMINPYSCRPSCGTAGNLGRTSWQLRYVLAASAQAVYEAPLGLYRRLWFRHLYF